MPLYHGIPFIHGPHLTMAKKSPLESWMAFSSDWKKEGA
jgi:hypothetical protein